MRRVKNDKMEERTVIAIAWLFGLVLLPSTMIPLQHCPLVLKQDRLLVEERRHCLIVLLCHVGNNPLHMCGVVLEPDPFLSRGPCENVLDG
jgi:hypothetical protein